jgi:hypothetical protein
MAVGVWRPIGLSRINHLCWRHRGYFFLAAWICPTFCLIGGGLPPDRIVAAGYAATLSGILLAALPAKGFRAARGVTATAFPLV